MRCLIAPQEFKGTLTAVQVADALARGVARANPQAQLDLAPIADGGPGTVDAALKGGDGVRQVSQVLDPLCRPVRAVWALLRSPRSAVIEMAAASGVVLLAKAERDPRLTTTFGTGELIRAALDEGCNPLIVGVGGSATNDGGTGAAQALGARFLDSQGQPLPPGGAALADLARIDLTGLDPRLKHTEICVAVDVQNPLYGSEGASRIYGPQKGATPDAVDELDAALHHLADMVKATLGIDNASRPGMGAAGGLAYGLATFCGGRLRPGFEQVAKFLDLETRIPSADVVLTGEGRLDAQSHYGKGPVSLARMARAHRKPVVVFAGSIDRSVEWRGQFDDAVEVSPVRPQSAPEATALIERAAEDWMRRFCDARSNRA